MGTDEIKLESREEILTQLADEPVEEPTNEQEELPESQEPEGEDRKDDVGQAQADEPAAEPDAQEQEGEEQELLEAEPPKEPDFLDKLDEELSDKPEPVEKDPLEEINLRLAEAEEVIKTYQWAVENPLQLLKQQKFPIDGAYAKDGKSVYMMTDEEVDNYLIELQEQGKMVEANRILANRTRALDLWQNFQEDCNKYARTYSELQPQKVVLEQQKEWQKVERFFLDNVPELQAHTGELEQYLSSKLQTDPKAVEQAKTEDGKKKLVMEAIRATGLRDKIRAQTTKNQKSPSAPETNPVRKKAAIESKPVFTQQQVDYYLSNGKGKAELRNNKALAAKLEQALSEGRIKK